MKAGDLGHVTPARAEIAMDWHGGQGSMLYAIASTGALTRGTLRPTGPDGPMTDDEWGDDLVASLRRELVEVAAIIDNAAIPEVTAQGPAVRAWLLDLDRVECRYVESRRVACAPGGVVVRLLWPDGAVWHLCAAHYNPHRSTSATVEHIEAVPE